MDRQAYIIKIAQDLITNSKLPAIYKIKIQHSITTNKLIYVKNPMRKIKITKTKSEYQRVFGTADKNSKIIRITGYCWEFHHSHMRTVDRQIKHTLVHEVMHIISGNSLHPGGLKAYAARVSALLEGK